MTEQTEQNNGAGGNAKNNGSAKKKKPTSEYRQLRRKFAKTPFRIPLTWWRHRGLVPADVFIASYPKSGVTWTRFVLFEMISGMPAGFKATNQLMSGIGLHTNGIRLLPGGGRLIGTHEQYRKQYKRAIYLVRDARDVVLSEWAYLSALDYFRDNLDEYISTFLLTCASAYGYGPWQRHVNSFLDSPLAGTDNLLLVRFEDLRKDPVLWFTRMAEFLGVNVEQEKIQLAVENNSIQKMREKEDKEPVRASIKGRFVREGNVRGWISKLTPAQVQLIEEHAGNELLRLGYPLSSALAAEEDAKRTGMQTKETARV
jgi:hypothetical protein